MPSSKTPLPTKIRHIDVVGYFSLVAGVGEGARRCAVALSDDGFEVSCTDVTTSAGKDIEYHWSKQENFRQENSPRLNPTESVRILHLNPPMLPRAIFRLGFSTFLSNFNIAYWAWELDTLPREWVNALRYVNALFVPSTFTANALARHTNKPIIVVPHPIEEGPVATGVRSRLCLPTRSFLVTTIFSFGSSLSRKFPEASVDAFRKAFPDSEDAYLIVKTTHGENYKADLAKLKSFIGNSANILLVDEIWSSEQISGLISEANVYISLHRSEGFGLTIAEAVLRGTPVIATNWSGNTDFCCPNSTSLISYQLVAANASDAVSAFHDGHWAEPNVDEAAWALRRVFETEDIARNKARVAKRYAEEYFRNRTYHDGLNKLGMLVYSGVQTSSPPSRS